MHSDYLVHFQDHLLKFAGCTLQTYLTQLKVIETYLLITIT